MAAGGQQAPGDEGFVRGLSFLMIRDKMSWNAPDASLAKSAERVLRVALVVAAVWGLLHLVAGVSSVHFDLDESGNWFIAGGTPSEAIERSLHMADKLPAYYMLLSVWKGWVGSSPIAMRSLSLMCIALGALYVTRLGNLVAPGFGLVTASLFMASSFLLNYAFEVQPYPFLILAALGLTYSVRSVYVGGAWVDVLKSIAWGACIAYTHLSGALYLAALACVILLVGIRRKATSQGRALLWLVIAFGIILAPLSLVALKIMSEKEFVSYGVHLTLPAFSELILVGLRPDVLAATLLWVIVICARREKLLSPDGMVLFLVVVPCFYVLISVLLSITIAPGYFSNRYIIAALAVLTCSGSFLFRFAESPRQRVGMLLLCLSVSLFFALANRSWGFFGPDWRQASIDIRDARTSREGRCSVLFCAGYIGSLHATLLKDPIWGGLFLSPFSYYRQHGCDLVPIPGDVFNPQNVRFFRDVAARTVEEGGEVFMVLPDGWVMPTPTKLYPIMMTSHCEALKPLGLGCQRIAEAQEISLSRVVVERG